MATNKSAIINHFHANNQIFNIFYFLNSTYNNIFRKSSTTQEYDKK